MDWAIVALVGVAPFWASTAIAVVRGVSAVFSSEKD